MLRVLVLALLLERRNAARARLSARVEETGRLLFLGLPVSPFRADYEAEAVFGLDSLIDRMQNGLADPADYRWMLPRGGADLTF